MKLLSLTLCDPMDCSLPGSSVHGIFQAGILEWVAISSPGDLPDPGIKPSFLHCRQTLYHLNYRALRSPKGGQAQLNLLFTYKYLIDLLGQINNFLDIKSCVGWGRI